MTRSAQRTTSDKPANELEILTKIEAMIAYCYTSTNQFPKAEKPGLARELRADSWELGASQVGGCVQQTVSQKNHYAGS